jgi:hypothetical protein
MRNKTPWYFYPPDEPKKHRGDDSLGVLVGVLLVLIVILVALDHALFHIVTVISAWGDAIGHWLAG